ncbi:MAG: class I SAM-dependent methyltransferase [bacterium]|nr:class I SAM-dependent methyltransferase [bacterium]
MKQLFIKILKALKLLDFALIVYGNLKAIKYMKLSLELRYRLKGAPDKHPFPTSYLIFKIIGHSWRSLYYNSGRLIVENMRHHLKANQIELKEFQSILDFGCGCGRLLRHFNHGEEIRLHGSDYNTNLIDWCQKKLKFAEFNTNQLAPPLKYEKNKFDFLYAQSVFTHLTKELQLEWLKEFHRVLKPGGVILFTTHGQPFFHKLTDEQKALLEKDGIIVLNHEAEGKNWCATLQLPRYLHQKIKTGFEIVGYSPGQEEMHLQQDINIFRKTGENCEFR